MLSKDPVKRGLNGYPYCGNDPVNHTDPTGEIPTMLAFDAGVAGNLLEQAINRENVNISKGILGGLSNAVSGAIFGNVPFKNAGQAFGKGALAGAATSGLGYLSDLIGRQPKSGQMGHFPGGAVTRTPYERLMDPRGTCILQDIFGGGLGVRKAYGYRYEMRDPDQPVRDGFDLGDFFRSTLIGGLMGGLSGVAFYGMDKAVGALKGSLSGGSKGSTDVWDMTEGGGIINGREYSQHAMERMAPDTPSVRAELSRRAEAFAESKGLQVGTQEYYRFCKRYVDPRNIPPSVIEDAIRNIAAVPGNTAGTFVHQTADVTVIVNDIGKVITVIPK